MPDDAEPSKEFLSDVTLDIQLIENPADSPVAACGALRQPQLPKYYGSTSVFHSLSAKRDIDKPDTKISKLSPHFSVPLHTMSVDRYDIRKPSARQDDDTDTLSVGSTISKLIGRIREANRDEQSTAVSEDPSSLYIPWK